MNENNDTNIRRNPEHVLRRLEVEVLNLVKELEDFVLKNKVHPHELDVMLLTLVSRGDEVLKNKLIICKLYASA